MKSWHVLLALFYQGITLCSQEESIAVNTQVQALYMNKEDGSAYKRQGVVRQLFYFRVNESNICAALYEALEKTNQLHLKQVLDKDSINSSIQRYKNSVTTEFKNAKRIKTEIITDLQGQVLTKTVEYNEPLHTYNAKMSAMLAICLVEFKTDKSFYCEHDLKKTE